jgi:colanic acid/amylovoran biosynthesis glycosyltransferase
VQWWNSRPTTTFVYWRYVNTLDQTRTEQESIVSVGAPQAPASAVRMGYLLSQYPAISHTFFLHEVLGLRARGMHLETVSINRPDRPGSSLPAAEAAEARRTHYIKDGKHKRALKNLIVVMLRRPDVVLRGLLAVLRMDGLRLRERGFWLFYLAEALLVGRWMKMRKLEHLHVHFGGPVASVGMLTSIAWKVPYSLTIHGPEELLNSDSYHLEEKIQQAKFVFCISDFCRSQLCALMPESEWEKFSVVRLGVDPLVLTPPSRPVSYGRRGDTTRLVCTGRMVPAKGHQVLLEAVKLLRDRRVPLHVTLIGGGPELIRLEEFVKQNELEEMVYFSHALSHPETLAQLRRADMFALASFAEGIPVALMEAMSLSLPCVSTYGAGIPELIRSGVDGLLVPPANPVALANALEILIGDRQLRRSLGSSARQRIINQYNLPLNQELLAHTFRLRTGATEIPDKTGQTA